MTNSLTLKFGRFSGRLLDEVPDSYLAWLANPVLKDKSTFDVPADIQEAAKSMLSVRKQNTDRQEFLKKRLSGQPATDARTFFIVERLGDLDGLTGHESLDAALYKLGLEFSISADGERDTPNPEDDRILIWEVLGSGHKKVVWHFSGWHWNADEFGLEQGKLPGDDLDLYSLAMRE